MLERIAPQRLADLLVRLGTAQTGPFSAATRAEAKALLPEVGAWYRSAEPSSPVPALLDSAGELWSMEFARLLTEPSGPGGDCGY